MANHVKGIGPGLDPARQYVQKRNINNLVTLAGLPAEEAALLKRADGVVANLPKDGYVATAELGDADFNALLLPAEGAHLPSAWNALSWDGKTPPADAKLPALAEQVRISPGAATPLDRDEPIAINLLPPALQLLAQRVQLKLNGDQNSGTISANEAESFGDGAFNKGLLPEEVALLPTLAVAVFEAQNRLHPYAPGDAVDVPALGRQTTRLNDSAALGVAALSSETSLVQTRNIGNRQLALQRQYALEVTVPPGAQGLLLDPTTGVEVMLPPGTTKPTVPPGDYLLEIWRNNTRVDASEFHLPDAPVEVIDLSQRQSAALTSAGAPLNLSFVSADVVTGQAKSASFTYVAGPGVAPPAGVILSLEQAKPTLAPGLYKANTSLRGYGGNSYSPDVPVSFTLEVRPDGTVTLNTSGLDQRLYSRHADTFGTLDAGNGAKLEGTCLMLYRSPYQPSAIEIGPADRVA